VQTKGQFETGELARLLEAADRERVTGSMELSQSRRQTTTLYFLFGHLFHATAGDREGQEVVFDALHWSGGAFTFNPRAMLKPDQTIRARTRDLLAAAGSPTREGAEIAPALNQWLLGAATSKKSR